VANEYQVMSPKAQWVTPDGLPTNAFYRCILGLFEIIGTNKAGTLIPDNSVTNAKLVQMAAKTLKGNAAAGLANVADLSVAQVQSLLGIVQAGPLSNALVGDVSLNNVANFFQGPSVAQGATGTWFASGSLVVQDATPGTNVILVQLTDGTTTLASGVGEVTGTGPEATVSLSGIIANPVGNLRLQAKDVTTVNGKILASLGGMTSTATLSAFRIA
jgi:X-X-X-Leu-X-X-Gly heptad repeat protein